MYSLIGVEGSKPDTINNEVLIAVFILEDV